jgi:hypothetical protein
MSTQDPTFGAAEVDASTRRVIAYGISLVFGIAVLLVFLTLWESDDAAQTTALSALTAVVGVFGTVLGYYFAKGD